VRDEGGARRRSRRSHNSASESGRSKAEHADEACVREYAVVDSLHPVLAPVHNDSTSVEHKPRLIQECDGWSDAPGVGHEVLHASLVSIRSASVRSLSISSRKMC
jgi:hypothetical protein